VDASGEEGGLRGEKKGGKVNALECKGLRIEFPVLLAPMAGYTDAAFRSLCLEMGAGAAYTELTSAEGLRHHSAKTFRLLEQPEAGPPVAGHLFGADPAALAEAARQVEALGCFSFIDLNCGCPVRKVTRIGAGAALLKDLHRLEACVRAVREAVKLPVSVKTRIGWSAADDSAAVARAAEQGGADFLAVHGRFAVRMHSGPVEFERLAAMKAAVRIPVVGNGGIAAPQDAVEMLERTGVDGVMIGRGAIGNPWLFRQIQQGLADEPVRFPDWAERRRVMETHLSRMVDAFSAAAAGGPAPAVSPEAAACRLFRPHLVKYLHGLRGRREMMRTLHEQCTVSSVLAAVDRVLTLN